MNNFDEEPNASDAADESSGSLADAIAAHLELKKEHGADPEEVAAEEASALGAANRDIDEPVDVPSAVEPPPAIEPESESEPEPIQEPAAESESEPEPERELEPEPEPEAIHDELPPEPEQEPAPAENTGTFEFKFGEGEEEAADEPEQTPEEAQAEHDLLEDTPDFFQETPEHDKLWFDEAPPKQFDF